jgi:hypothetical protein
MICRGGEGEVESPPPPKTAFSRFPAVHRADLEGQQRVDSTRWPGRRPRSAICAKRTRLNHSGGLRGVKATLPGLNAAPATPGSDGLIRIWLDPKVADALGGARGPGESFCDVILRLAKAS